MGNFIHFKSVKYFFIFIIGVFFLASCAKTSSNKPSTQQGDIKITAHYTPYTTGNWSYTLSGSVKIELFQSGNSKGVLYGDGSNAVDFGNFNYGSYTVTVSYTEGGVASGGFYTTRNGTKSQDFSVNSSPTIIDVEIP